MSATLRATAVLPVRAGASDRRPGLNQGQGTGCARIPGAGRFRAALVLLLALAVLPGTAAAQVPTSDPRPGAWTTVEGEEIRPATFWWDVAGGVAGLQVSCDFCQSNVDGGPAIDLSGGVYASRRVALGLAFSGWTRSEGDVRETLYRAGIMARFEPRRARGIHLIGGAGWSFWGAEDFGYNAPHLTLGMGYSIPVSSSWALGLRGVLDVAPHGTLANGDTPVAEGTRMSTGRMVLFFRSR